MDQRVDDGFPTRGGVFERRCFRESLKRSCGYCPKRTNRSAHIALFAVDFGGGQLLVDFRSGALSLMGIAHHEVNGRAQFG
jgi:hypothetical protein